MNSQEDILEAERELFLGVGVKHVHDIHVQKIIIIRFPPNISWESTLGFLAEVEWGWQGKCSSFALHHTFEGRWGNSSLVTGGWVTLMISPLETRH